MASINGKRMSAQYANCVCYIMVKVKLNANQNCN